MRPYGGFKEHSLVISIVQYQKPGTVILITQPVKDGLDDIGFRILRSWYLQPPSDLLVSLIEPSDAAAVYPQDVAVWVLGLVLVTVLNRNLRFTVSRQWSPIPLERFRYTRHPQCRKVRPDALRS
jgi:hypothetical protein